MQAEAQFAIKQISSEETKFWHTVAALDQDVAVRCSSFLETLPKADRYTAFKQHLLTTFELSEDERADSLLDLRELGDRRPSELVDMILHQNGSAPTHFLLRRIFLRALPAPLRNALATSTTVNLRDLGREADRALTSVKGIISSLSNVHADPQIAATNARHQLCSYHRKYGVRARHCTPPCDWKSFPPRPQGNAMRCPR